MLCIPSVGYSDLTEEISSAVKNGDFNLVNKLLVDNQSFSGVFSEVYARILTEMSGLAHLEASQVLALEQFESFGVRIPQTDENARSAISSGNSEMMEFLLKHGLDPNPKTPTITLKYGEMGGVTHEVSYSLLGLAIVEGHQPLIQLLLGYANVKEDDSALFAAEEAGDFNLFVRLLERGADPRKLLEAGLQSLDRIYLRAIFQRVSFTQEELKIYEKLSEGRWTEILEEIRLNQLLLSTQGDPDKALCKAIEEGNRKAVNELLTRSYRKANIEARCDFKRTPIMVAIVSGQMEIFQDLLRFRPKLDVTDWNGSTLSILIAQHDDPEVINWIPFTVNDLTIRDNSGWTALMYVASRGNYEVFRALMGRSGNTDLSLKEILDGQKESENEQKRIISDQQLFISTASGWIKDVQEGRVDEPPDEDSLSKTKHLLQLAKTDWEAAKKVLKEMYEENLKEDGDYLFLKLRASYFDLQDDNGLTPLMLAVINGHHKMVQGLLKFGADPNVRSKDGWTAIMLAKFHNEEAMVVDLLENGALFSEVEKMGVEMAQRLISR